MSQDSSEAGQPGTEAGGDGDDTTQKDIEKRKDETCAERWGCVGDNVCEKIKNFFITFDKLERTEAGWRFFLYYIIFPTIGWYIGLTIGTNLAKAFYPRSQTVFFRKLCTNDDPDSITAGDIWGFAFRDMGMMAFAGPVEFAFQTWTLHRHREFIPVTIPPFWWWIFSAGIWPFAWVIGDVIVLSIDPTTIKNYAPWLFSTTPIQGFFIGISQWIVMRFILPIPSVEIDPKQKFKLFLHDTIQGLWWIPMCILGWGISMPAGVQCFFWCYMMAPHYKLPTVVVVLGVVAAIIVLYLTMSGGAYGNPRFCQE